jgi:hypothetical protein
MVMSRALWFCGRPGTSRVRATRFWREPSRGDESSGDGVRPRQLRPGFTRAMFSCVPGRPARTIDRLMLMFAAPGAAPGRHHLVRFWRDEAGSGRSAEVECVAGEAWPGFFCGAVDLREHPLGPLRDRRPENCTFRVPRADREDTQGLRGGQLRRRARQRGRLSGVPRRSHGSGTAGPSPCRVPEVCVPCELQR